MTFIQFLKSKTFLIQVGIALGVTFVLIYILLLWLDSTTHHGEEVIVPDLKSLTIEEANKLLEEKDLSFVVLDTLHYDPKFPKFSVLEQEPVANYKVKSGRKIYLKLNAADYQIVSVPDLVEKTLRQAEPTLKALGLQVGKINYQPYLAKDMVLEMKFNGKILKPGDKLPKTSAIDLTLGDGTIAFDEEEFEGAETENNE